MSESKLVGLGPQLLPFMDICETPLSTSESQHEKPAALRQTEAMSLPRRANVAIFCQAA